MTVYRRRAASSPYALEQSLRRRQVLFLTLIRVSPPAIGNILPPVEGERG
jgi:hypothetical protein